MRQRKNGFTLIELLAVIIILAAIALIIAPLVLDVIKEQQMKTFKESINGILRSSRLELVNSGLKFPATFTYHDGKLVSPTGKELKVTGKISNGTGSVIYNSEDDITLAINDQTWCGTYSKEQDEISVEEYEGECSLTMTPLKCFDYMPVPDTVINYDQCVLYFDEDFYSEELDIFCSGGSVEGDTLFEAIEDGFLSFDVLLDDGVIVQNNGIEDGVIITKYDKNNIDCPMDVVIPEKIDGKTVKEIGPYAFVDNLGGVDERKITSVIFSSGLEKIAIGAFLGEEYEEVSYYSNFNDNGINYMSRSMVGSEVQNLSLEDDSMYCGASNCIQSLNFNKANNLKIIGSYAFSNNIITQLQLPSNLERIGDYAFYYNQLERVIFQDGIKKIGSFAFSENRLMNLIMPNTITEVASYAFSGNQLNDVILSNQLTVIDYYSFSGNQLTDVTIPSGVKEIRDGVFSSNQLTNVIIPDTVRMIGYDAFFNNQLTNVVIPGSVKTIGGSAFQRNLLTSVTISDGVTAIEDEAFDNNPITDVVIPKSVVMVGGRSFPKEALSRYQEGDFIIVNHNLLYYMGTAKDVVIPSTVTHVGSYAFDSKGLTSVTIPNSVTHIGRYAFYYNSIPTITVPPSVTTIGYAAFLQSNRVLTKVINQTGKAFGWGAAIIGSFNYTAFTFVTGTVTSGSGYSVQVVAG